MGRIARFGVFELDVKSGELRKQGVKLKLQGKAFLLLKSLVERPGEVVTREELHRTLWPAGVFVDAETGLNTAANRLRFALGDSAESPRYIETVARSGYRFIAPVEFAESQASPAALGAGPIRTARTPLIVAVALAVIAVVVSATTVAFRRPSPGGFQFRQVTFRHGQVAGARFAPDGHTILYTAAWDNGPRQLYLTNPYSPESRRLGLDEMRLVAVSRSGELALLSSDGNSPISGGVLARVPMNGGAPIAVDRNVMSADWSADGRLAIVRATEGMNQLEFPIGHVLHKTAGWISGIRIAPRGDRIAFIEHPVRHDNRGTVHVIDSTGPARSLTPEWANAGGLAWHGGPDEIWFTASRDGEPKSLWAVTLNGEIHSITQIAGTMTLRDVTADGRALVTRESEQLEMALVDGESQENLSWLDWSRVVDISRDGGLILFDESGVAAGSRYRIYLHRRDTHATMLVGEGRAMALSPDGRFALTLDADRLTQFHVVPIADPAAGKSIDVPPTGLEYQWARYSPDGQRLLALANERNGPLRLYVQPLNGKPLPISPPIVVRNVALSPSGDRVAVLSGKGKLAIYQTTGMAPAQEVATPGMLAPLLWTADDWLYVQHIGAYTQIPTRISRLHLRDGRLESVRDLRPSDALGVNAITKVMISPDTKIIVFNYRRVLSELFVLEPAQTGRENRSTAGS